MCLCWSILGLLRMRAAETPSYGNTPAQVGIFQRKFETIKEYRILLMVHDGWFIDGFMDRLETVNHSLTWLAK